MLYCLNDGELSERFKELVLKTSDSERNLGFESLTLRQKKTYALIQSIGLFQRNKSLAGFVKYASRVKYCFAMRNACGREWIYFISLDATASNFTIHEVNYFTFAVRQIFHSFQIVKIQVIVKLQL